MAKNTPAQTPEPYSEIYFRQKMEARERRKKNWKEFVGGFWILVLVCLCVAIIMGIMNCAVSVISTVRLAERLQRESFSVREEVARLQSSYMESLAQWHALNQRVADVELRVRLNESAEESRDEILNGFNARLIALEPARPPVRLFLTNYFNIDTNDYMVMTNLTWLK